MDSSTNHPKTLEIYADIWCPFTHVGLRRLLDRRAEIGSDLPMRIRPWPLETINGSALDCAFIDDEIQDLRDQAAGDLFLGFDKDNFPSTTIPALALAESAYGVGYSQGEQVSVMLRDYMFEEGKNISDQSVLAEIADVVGVPAPTSEHFDAVAQSLVDGKERGVLGSPHFLTQSEGFFCPALDIKRVDGHLQIKADVAVFESFVETVFAD